MEGSGLGLGRSVFNGTQDKVDKLKHTELWYSADATERGPEFLRCRGEATGDDSEIMRI